MATTPGHDWSRIEASPVFRELHARRRRFVLPATVFFLLWYFGFIVLAGYAEDFMGESVYQGLTVGYCLALTQFVMVAVLGVTYLSYSRKHLDPLREQALREAEGGGGAAREARFGRGPDEPVAPAPAHGEETAR